MSRASGLKSAVACLLGRLLTPGCRPDAGDGLSKPNREPDHDKEQHRAARRRSIVLISTCSDQSPASMSARS